MIRRREVAASTMDYSAGFADQLANRYQARLAGETLMVNELYLTLVFRPVTGAVPSLVSKLMSRGSSAGSPIERADAIEPCIKLSQTVTASLAR